MLFRYKDAIIYERNKNNEKIFVSKQGSRKRLRSKIFREEEEPPICQETIVRLFWTSWASDDDGVWRSW